MQVSKAYREESKKKRNLYSLSLQVFLLHALFFRLFVRTDEVPGDKDVTDYFIAQLVPYMHGFESLILLLPARLGPSLGLTLPYTLQCL
jgi:hypothetical protein